MVITVFVRWFFEADAKKKIGRLFVELEPLRKVCIRDSFTVQLFSILRMFKQELYVIVASFGYQEPFILSLMHKPPQRFEQDAFIAHEPAFCCFAVFKRCFNCICYLDPHSFLFCKRQFR